MTYCLCSTTTAVAAKGEVGVPDRNAICGKRKGRRWEQRLNTLDINLNTLRFGFEEAYLYYRMQSRSLHANLGRTNSGEPKPLNLFSGFGSTLMVDSGNMHYAAIQGLGKQQSGAEGFLGIFILFLLFYLLFKEKGFFFFFGWIIDTMRE